MTDVINGAVIQPPAQGQQVDRFASEVQTGLARYYAIVQELEVVRADLRNATLDNERLRVALAGAAERERAHVQVVIDEAKIAQAKAEIEVSMLTDEVASLRRDVSAANRMTQDARVEAARLTAALTMLGSNVIEILNQRPAQVLGGPKQEVVHAGR